MSINSRQKGAAAEREFAGLIHDHLGIRMVRNLEQTRGGGFDLVVHPDQDSQAADVMRACATECKRYALATPAKISGWWDQTIRQANESGKVPVLAYRQDRHDWLILIPAHIISEQLPTSIDIQYTARLSIHGFSAVVRELGEQIIKGAQCSQ